MATFKITCIRKDVQRWSPVDQVLHVASAECIHNFRAEYAKHGGIILAY